MACPGSVIQAAWIKKLGYTYKIQEPKWRNYETPIYDLPVGSTIHFYCQDPKKRPKNDEWDMDQFDQVLSGSCTHTGVFDITMNPAGIIIR